MKKIFVIILSLYSQFLFANMASPIMDGTMMGSPFTSRNIDILSEKIVLRLSEDFLDANYEVEYRILASADGRQIPLLFFAMDYKDNFKVWLDGEPVELRGVSDVMPQKDYFFWKEYSELFDTSSNYSQYDIKDKYQFADMYHISTHNLHYFNIDLSKGEHVIKVSYNAIAEKDRSGWVSQYKQFYALSPAKHWKSFGSLEFVLDASDFNNEIKCSFGQPTSGSLDSVAIWKFNKLPADLITIEYNPKTPAFAQALIDFGLDLTVFLVCLLLAANHFLVMLMYRKKRLDKRFSWVMMVGSAIVPLIYVLLTIYIRDFIDHLIGPHASGNHGYIFLLIFIYPMITPIYWVIAWLTDRIYRRKMLKGNSDLMNSM